MVHEMGDINKLPKWAKHEIERLESNVAYYKRQADEINGDKDTNTFISNLQDKAIPLPKDSRVIFVTNPDRNIECGQLQVRLVDDEIEIYGSEQLHIRTHASNMCYIKQERI